MKIVLLLTLLALASTSTGKAIVKVYNSIEDYRVEHPDANLIPLIAEDLEIDGSRNYSIGRRQTGKSMEKQEYVKNKAFLFAGDSVVANANNKKSWPTAQNVTTTLTYPSSGNGAFLTYILINCEQSSNLGQAYITYGGIGQHFVQIIVEAQVTTYFNYAAFFYGIK